MTQPNQPIPCPPWCLTDHTESGYHARRTLGQTYAEVEALLMPRPGFESVKWVYCKVEDPEYLFTPNEAREVAYALLQAAAILDAEPLH